MRILKEIILLVIVFVIAICYYSGCGEGGGEKRNLITSDEPQPVYSVMFFDIGKSMDDPAEDYYVARGNKTLNKVLLEENRSERIDAGGVYHCYEEADYVFYNKCPGGGVEELWRYHKEIGEKEMFASVDMRNSFGIRFVGDYIFVEDRVLDEAWICPKDGDIEKDRINVHSLFPEENRTGDDQIITIDNIEISRYYYAQDQRYYINYVKNLEKRKWGERFVDVEGKELKIWSEDEGFYYGYEDGEIREIECLESSRYEYLSIEEGVFLTSDEMIIGFLPREQLRGHPFLVGPPKYREVLISLNPDTGESEILCETEDNNASMIGYREGRLYFIKDFKVYRQDLDSGVEEELFDLPSPKEVREIRWRAGYLIFYGYDGVLGIYQLE